MKLAFAQTMRNLDAAAIEGRSIPSAELMETAAGHVAAGALAFLPQGQGRAAVFCGLGNNGGDGVAAGRMLRQAGVETRVFLVGSREKMTADTKEMERRLEAAGGRLEPFDAEDPDQRAFALSAQVMVDAIFGIGLKRPLEGLPRQATELMNESPAPVVAADIPSGVETDTGEILGVAVHAAKTITFTLGKPGQFTGPGSVCCGDVEIVDIGIPVDLTEQVDNGVFLMTEDLVQANLPKRRKDGHKGTFGKIAIFAGALGYTGAPYFAAQGAGRTGAGLTFLMVPQNIYEIEAVKNAEAMVFPLPMEKGNLTKEAVAAFWAQAGICNVILAGPGLGRGVGTETLLKAILEQAEVPLILDADGLNYLAGHIDELEKVSVPVVLTPHEGEFVRLGGETAGGRVQGARSFVQSRPCILILKGHGTVTALPDGTVFINPTGNSGMAKGGSGDVLAGMLAALIGQGMEPKWAAPAAVWLHGKAGDLCAEAYGEHGMLPSDMLMEIPRAIRSVLGHTIE